MRRRITPWQLVAVLVVLWLIPVWALVGSGASVRHAALWPVHAVARLSNAPGGAFAGVPANW